MLQKLNKLFWVSRPVSWLNTAFPFGAGYLVSGGSIDTVFLVGVFYFLVPYNLLMYGVNDVFDYESDISNPRKGGIEGMREQKAFHPTIIWAAITTNVPFVVCLAIAGTSISRWVLAGLLFFVLAYSIAGLRFKERPFLDSITSSLHFVGPLVYALSLTGSPVNAGPYLLAFFLWGMASHAFGAVQDIVPDREAKISSIATAFGARATVWFAFLVYIAASVMVAAQGVLAIAVAATGLLYAINCAPYLTVTDNESQKTNRGWRRFIWLNLFTGFVITITLIVVTIVK